MAKILKISIFMFIILIVNTSLSAQESETGKDKSGITHEIGINATFFIQQFISLGTSTNVNASPYAITYRRIKSNRRIFRAGFGINGINTETDQSGTTSKSHAFALNTRFGIERQFNIGKRWSTSVGGDLRSGFEHVKTESSQFQGDFTTIDEVYSNGIGPVLGIRFDITEKIGLYTESAFVTSVIIGKSTNEFSQSDSSVSKQTIFTTNFSLPTSIYFTLKF